jgi:hypothetical protein
MHILAHLRIAQPLHLTKMLPELQLLVILLTPHHSLSGELVDAAKAVAMELGLGVALLVTLWRHAEVVLVEEVPAIEVVGGHGADGAFVGAAHALAVNFAGLAGVDSDELEVARYGVEAGTVDDGSKGEGGGGL